MDSTDDRKRYGEFNRQLQGAIQNTGPEITIDKSAHLARILQAHRHMKNKGLLNEDQYQDAKQRIVSSH